MQESSKYLTFQELKGNFNGVVKPIGLGLAKSVCA